MMDAAPQNPMRILLVEDNPDHREMLRAALTDAGLGADLTFAGSGREALAVLHRDAPADPDCILLDFNLPDYDAPDLVPVLTEACPACPIIIISSNQDQGAVIESMRHGCVDFIPKAEAVIDDVVAKRIEQAMSRRQNEQAQRRRVIRRAREWARLAEQDPLTGLSNRRHLDRMLTDHRAQRDRRGSTTIIMLDLDRFKQINDQHGHVCGDAVLRGVARVIEQHLDGAAMAYRYGGEEFLVVRPGDTYAATVRWAESLREKVAALPIPTGKQTIHVTTSIGLVEDRSARLGERAIEQADQAMYVAKQLGRDRVCTWRWVVFHEAATHSELPPAAPLAERIDRLLEATAEHLGPTQSEHLRAHSREVGRVAQRLAETLGLSAAHQARVRDAGFCHDLGKFLVPEAVLAKATPLSPDERFLLARHAADSAVLARLIGADEETALCIWHHHTPLCAAAGVLPATDAAIPIGARILAVADAFVAMTSCRPYQPTRSRSSAISELQRLTGRHFDAQVVSALPHTALRDPKLRAWSSHSGSVGPAATGCV